MKAYKYTKEQEIIYKYKNIAISKNNAIMSLKEIIKLKDRIASLEDDIRCNEASSKAFEDSLRTNFNETY